MSKRFAEIKELKDQGMSNPEISLKLGIASNTVKTYLRVYQSKGKSLGEKERVIAKMVSLGISPKEVARTLSISVKTVQSHLFQAYRKLDIRNRQQLTILNERGKL